jgi:hypothetical protein
MKDYHQGLIENGGKLVVLFRLIQVWQLRGEGGGDLELHCQRDKLEIVRFFYYGLKCVN